MVVACSTLGYHSSSGSEVGTFEGHLERVRPEYHGETLMEPELVFDGDLVGDVKSLVDLLLDISKN